MDWTAQQQAVCADWREGKSLACAVPAVPASHSWFRAGWKHIRHEDGKWVLYDHTGKRVLGRYPSYTAALRRERQIEYFKHKTLDLMAATMAHPAEVPWSRNHRAHVLGVDEGWGAPEMGEGPEGQDDRRTSIDLTKLAPLDREIHNLEQLLATNGRDGGGQQSADRVSLRQRLLDALKKRRQKNLDNRVRINHLPPFGKVYEDHRVSLASPDEVGEEAATRLLQTFPDVRQPNHYACGAAATCAVHRYYGVGPVEVSECERVLGTTVEHSTHPYAIRDELTALGLAIEAADQLTLDDLDRYTRQGWPVIVPIQDYGQQREPGASFAYGHYVVVLGVVRGMVLIQDSAIENAALVPGGDVPRSQADPSGNIAAPGRAMIAANVFLRCWHDKDVNDTPFIHYGIAVGPLAEKPTGEKSWDESRHPRGQPGNAGQFASGHGSSSARATRREQPAQPAQREERGTRRDPDQKPDIPPTRDEREIPPDTEPAPRPDEFKEPARPSSSAEQSPLHRSIEQSPLVHAKKLTDAGTEAYVITLKDGMRAVYKPARGEYRGARIGVKPGTGYQREIAMSRVANVLGYGDLVPVTTLRDQKTEGVGSAQVYLDKAKNAFESDAPFDGQADAARAAALDYLSAHLDRHVGNWMLDNEKLQLIDNGLSFPVTYNAGDFFNMKFWEHAVQSDLSLPDLSEWKEQWPAVEKELRDSGLEADAIHLTKQRFDALTSGKYQKVSELPSLLDEGQSLKDMVNTYSRAAREQQMRAIHERRLAALAQQPTHLDAPAGGH